MITIALSHRKGYKKQIPTTEDFRHNCNDLVYGWLQYSSFYDEELGINCIYKRDIAGTLADKLQVSLKTIRRYIAVLKDLGYLKEFKKAGKACYELVEVKDTFKMLIDIELLEYMLEICSPDLIKTYCFIKNGVEFYKTYGFSQYFLIQNIFGIDGKNEGEYERIDRIMDALKKLEIIDYEKVEIRQLEKKPFLQYRIKKIAIKSPYEKKVEEVKIVDGYLTLFGA